MTPHASQLRQSFLLAMGLGSMSLALLPACKPKDVDGDGFVADQDCDDANAALNPNAEEICDGVDNNCDGVVDADATDRSTWYTDADNDGYGDPLGSILACKAPESAVSDNTDCAPDEATAHPGAEENHTDRIDNDCDGMVDEMACPKATTPKSAKQVQATLGKKPLMFCSDAPEEGQSCPSPSEVKASTIVKRAVGNAPGGFVMEDGSYSMSWLVTDAVCGPNELNPDSCCYVFRVGSMGIGLATGMGIKGTLSGGDIATIGEKASKPVHGRPLTVNGTPRVAPTATNTDWFEVIVLDLSALTDEQRSQLAKAWQQAGLYEHASVASFARFALELMALRAPPELLLAASEAQADEVLHARACFSMATAFSREFLGPGELDLNGAMDREVTPQQVLVQTILEGCINETLAAAEAAWLSEKATLEPIRRVLKQIAEDESRHAALGWKTVRWILQQRPELVDSAQDAFAQGRHALTVDETESKADAWMAPYGCMPTHEKAALCADVWQTVIDPCAQALLTLSPSLAQAKSMQPTHSKAPKAPVTRKGGNIVLPSTRA